MKDNNVFADSVLGKESSHSLIRLSMIAAAVFCACSTYAQTARVGGGDDVVDTENIVVTAGSLSTTTENSNTYKSSAMSTTTGLELSPRETPQSVSNITKKQIDDQGITNIDDALKTTTGVMVIPSSGKSRIMSRGFYISQIEEDGISGPLVGGANGNVNRDSMSMSDLAIYDHIEVVRGPTGLTQSASEPGGTINVVRKKPTSEFQASAEVDVGSWDYYRGVADISGSLNDAKTLRGRLVGVMQKRNSFKDTVESQSGTLYGVIEADLAESTKLTVGGLFQESSDVPDLYGVPLGLNGADLNLPESAYFGFDWQKEKFVKRNLFAELEHYFNDDWRVTAKATYTTTNSWSSYGALANFGTRKNPYYGVNPDDPVLKANNFSHYANSGKLFGATVTLNGVYRVFGQEHDLFVTTNYSYTHTNSNYRNILNSTEFNIWNFTGSELAEPDWFDNNNLYYNIKYNYVIRDMGIRFGTRYNFNDDWHLIAGARYAKYKTESISDSPIYEGKVSSRHSASEQTDSRLIPYLGLTWDVTDSSSIYVSYTSIFNPQSGMDINGNSLKPIVGVNYEFGIKSEFFNNRLNTSVAVFWLEQQNRALDLDTQIDGVWRYDASGEVLSKGFEAEVSGEVLPGWNVFAGYTWNMNEYRVKESSTALVGQTFRAFVPKHLFKLYTSWNLPGAAHRWTIGGGVQAQSSAMSAYNIVTPGNAIWNANVQYKPTNNLQVSFIVNNLFDKEYYLNVNNRHYGGNNFLGDPRNFTLKLNYQY